jgi:hypothetical protein
MKKQKRFLSIFVAVLLFGVSVAELTFANDLRVSNGISVSFDIPFAPDRVIVKMADSFTTHHMTNKQNQQHIRRSSPC